MTIVRVLYGVALVSLAAGAALGADLYSTYESLKEPSRSSFAREKVQEKKPASKAGKADTRIIARRNLFSAAPLGSRSAKKKPPPRGGRKTARRRALIRPKPPKAAALPSLGLRLVGTTIGPAGARFAIFSEKGAKKQSIHRIGTKIRGAVIQKVNRGEVSLLYGGKIQVLRAFEEKENKSSRAPFSSRAAPPAGAPPAGPAAPGTPSPGSLTLKRVLRRERISRIVDSAAALEKQFRTVPFQGGEEGSGVRVFPAGRGRILQMLGVRGGDVVSEVNGNAVRTKDELGEALMELLGQDEGEIRVLRRGRKIQISYRIQ